MNLHTAGHRRGVVAAPHHAAAEAGRAMLAEGGNAHRGDGRDGGDDRRGLSAHEPYRRRRLLAGARTVRARARADGGGPGGREGDARALSRERPRHDPAARSARRAHGAGRGRRMDAGAGGGEKPTAGKLPLDVLLGPAIRHAREGYKVTRSQARLTAEKLAECKDVPGFAEDVPGRWQAASGGRDAEAGGARRDARSARQCGAWRLLPRRCRARDRGRSGPDRQPGHARRSRALPRRRSPSRSVGRAAGRHGLQHAAADAGTGLADHPGAVRALARRRRPRASITCTGWSRRPSARSWCAIVS